MAHLDSPSKRDKSESLQPSSAASSSTGGRLMTQRAADLQSSEQFMASGCSTVVERKPPNREVVGLVSSLCRAFSVSLPSLIF